MHRKGGRGRGEEERKRRKGLLRPWVKSMIIIKIFKTVNRCGRKLMHFPNNKYIYEINQD
jgi:hypothetical protein